MRVNWSESNQSTIPCFVGFLLSLQSARGQTAEKLLVRKLLLYRLIFLLFNWELLLKWSKILLFFQLVKRWQVTWRLRHRLQNNTTENKWHTGKKKTTITLFKRYWVYFWEGCGQKSQKEWFLAKFPCTYNVNDHRVFTKTCNAKYVFECLLQPLFFSFGGITRHSGARS